MEDTDNPGTVIFVGPSGNPGADRGYGPRLPGWHYYVTDANLVCPAELACTEEEMAEYLARFTVPGWDPNNPVVDRGRYPVYDPRNDIFARRSPGRYIKWRPDQYQLDLTWACLPRWASCPEFSAECGGRLVRHH